jgi:sugar lactone lactonase YvrE
MNPMTKRAVTAALAATLIIPTATAWGADNQDQVLNNLPLYEIETLSGSGEMGSDDGDKNTTTYRGPMSVAVKADGTILVSDAGNQQIRAIAGGKVSTVAGFEIGVDDFGFMLGGLLDGKADESAFQGPAGIAIDQDGRTIIADSVNNAIRAIAADGTVTTIAGDGTIGTADGKGAEARFNSPLDVAVSASGTIYVADTLNHAIRSIKDGVVTTLNAVAERPVEVFPGEAELAGDYKDGKLSEALFNEPSGLAIDAKGNLYVSDTGNQRIRYIDMAAGTVTTVAGSGVLGEDALYVAGEFQDGAALEARFHAPKGMAVTSDGGLLIADSRNHVIRYLKDGQVVTVAGVPVETVKSNGVAAHAGFNIPTDVAILQDGSIVVADYSNNRVRVVKPYQKPQGLADAKIDLVYNDAILATDADPVIVAGTTFVPVRVISETLGYKVDFGDNGVTTLTRGEQSYQIEAGKTAVTSSAGGSLTLPVAPFIQQDRLYLPVRFFAEQIELDVKWLSAEKAVLLRDRLAAE